MKLNLGSGTDRREGWVNVDRYPQANPDLVWNLENLPWPWETDSVDQILLRHVLEHIGQAPDLYLAIIQEIYRVCKNGAQVHIEVPYPTHADFLGDPTHCRPVTVESLRLFDRKYANWLIENKCPGTPLAVYLNVDFDMTDWAEAREPSGEVRTSRFVLKVRK